MNIYNSKQNTHTMRFSALLFLLALLSACTNEPTPSVEQLPADGPIRLHPENPHYFLYKGQPLALITSAEHYGALLNLDFDYRTYLQTLAEDGMNYTRIFTGSYFEIPGESFGIQNNTLAPTEGSIIAPWATVISDLSGEAQYDLSTWNEAYFQRLNDLMTVAAENDIIVEVTLFSSIYRNKHWDICPQNPANNINIPHEISRLEAQTLNNGRLFEFQEQFVRKMVNALNGFDNFFFEIQNEPWADHPVAVYNIVNKENLNPGDWTYKADFAGEAAMAWQDSLATAIADEESNLPQKHLIAQNYTNFKAPIPEVSDLISIINFHYAWPEAVEWNYHYDKVIGFDESGFAGAGDQVYRRQAWQFMISGGGLFNNLDYSFSVGNENGTGDNNAPGGGSETLRRQLKILSDFLHSFELPKLHPDCTAVESSPGLIPYILSAGNEAYAIFLRAVGTERTRLHLKTGDGTYRVQSLNTITGAYGEAAEVTAENGVLKIGIEIPEGELALKIVKE
jgi:hypothetical protein